MISRSLLTALFAVLVSAAAHAQDASSTPGQTATVPAVPRLRAPGSGADLPSPNATSALPDTPLMPDQTPSLVKPESEEKPKKVEKLSKTEQFSQDIQTKIKFREALTKAQADKAVQDQWERSLHVRTDAEKRTVLKQYYKLLYARMEKIDTTLKPQIALKSAEAERRLTQTRITPTEGGDEGERSTAARVFSDQ